MSGLAELLATLPRWYPPLVIGIYGLLLGSFLNVVIYRLPRRESLVRPRSHCPSCGALVHWYQNLPVVSWLALGRKCASCRAPISIRYPLVEVTAAATLLLVWARFGASIPFLVFAPFALALVALFAIDYDHQLLPDRITKPGVLVGLLLSGPNPQVSVLDAALGTIVGYGLLWLIAESYRRLQGQEGLGGGDLKLAAMIGAFTGPKGVIEVLLLASFAGVLVGVPLMLLGKAGMKTALPFGCFLAPAALLVALVGPEVLWNGWQAGVFKLWGFEPLPQDPGATAPE